MSLVGFVRAYLRAGRLWLAWAVCGLRTLSLILNFVFTPNLNYREITALLHVSFLGETVAVGEGIPNPWMLIGQLSLLLLVIFVADAAATVWQRGDRRQALWVGGSIVFLTTAGTTQAFWRSGESSMRQSPRVCSIWASWQRWAMSSARTYCARRSFRLICARANSG